MTDRGLAPAPSVPSVQAEAALRMSVLNAVLAIQNYRAANGSVSGPAAARLLAGGLAGSANFDYRTAVSLTAYVEDILEPAEGDRSSRFRALLERLILTFRPSWGLAIPRGRRFVASYMPPNTLQCFESARLYETPLDVTARQWWDRIAAEFRSLDDARKLATGRAGEERTMQYETARMAAADRPDLVPEWVALEDNTVGYDVRSFRFDGPQEHPLLIEVKATTLLPVRFFVSRNEWRRAIARPDSHVFYIWHLPSDTLTQIRPEELSAHIPEDRGAGTWQEVEVVWPEPPS